MNMQKLMLYIGYTAGIIFIVLGIVILFTDLFPTYNPGFEQLRLVFGGVMVLYGVYRIVMINFKKRRADEETE